MEFVVRFSWLAGTDFFAGAGEADVKEMSHRLECLLDLGHPVHAFKCESFHGSLQFVTSEFEPFCE
jgi:hypothetical protein